jgi:CheY-like chemotaxis protein
LIDSEVNMPTLERTQPRLLIVDPRNILHLQYADCTAAVGFQLERARNHDQGLAIASLLAPDLVLTECSADVRTGVEFCRRLKARLSTSRIPVLGLIAADDAETATAAVAAGCTVLAKPCSPERLLVEIVRVLGVWPPGSAVAARASHTPTVEQLTEMLGRLLRENAQLMQRTTDLATAAELWANWYERALKRADQVERRAADVDLATAGQRTNGTINVVASTPDAAPPKKGMRPA